MPAPQWLARFNRVGTNRLTRPFAARLPCFGVVVHQGRRTGTTYRTPVNLFRRAGGYTIALTYGSQSEWTRNVLAAGGCEILTRGRRHAVGSPVVRHDENRSLVPLPVRPVLGVLRVHDFLLVEEPSPAP
jgi:deazaflavin-dependent oxidoreductase (nitroreductase family)